MRLPHAFCAVAICLAAVSPALAQEGPTRRIEALVSKYAADARFRGSVLVVRRGKPAFERAYGVADEEWRVPNDLSTRFEVASLTKQFTGAAILLLAQDGRLDPTDPITKYYPGGPESWRAITIEQLAQHTSGLPANEIADFPKGICTPYTPDELIRTFAGRPLLAPPGTQWKYTNTEYYLLAYIIEKVSGMSYGEFLSTRIFEPLKMHDSGFASTLAIVPHMAAGYAREGAHLRHRDYFDRSLEIGAGGVYTTPRDLWTWSRALSDDRLLRAPWRARMFAPSAAGNYGYGWFVDSLPRPRQYHEGSDPGFAAFEIRLPRDDDFIVVLSNLEDAPVREIATGIEALLER